MNSNVIPLPTAETKRAPFAFSKTSIRKALDAIGPNVRNVTLRDTEQRGLVLRKQRRDWQFLLERKVSGRKWRVTLEEWTGYNDLAHLRSEVRRLLAEIDAGTYQTPAQRAAAASADKEGTRLREMTLASALSLHKEVNPRLRPKSMEAYAYAVCNLTGACPRELMRQDVDTKPMRIADVTTQTIRRRYDTLCDANSIATANSMLRSIRAIWATWASEHPEGKEPLRNPVAAITRKRGRVVKVKPRQGALTAAQRLPWISNIQSRANDAAAALAFIFFTGVRRDEALGLRWDEVGEDTICIGADRMKAGDELIRPITPQMHAILDTQRGKHPTFVFPAKRGPGHLTETRKTLWTVNEAIGVTITIHDLRRTFAAAAALSGIPDIAVKLLLGHATSDVTDAYKSALRSELPELAARVEAELLREVV